MIKILEQLDRASYRLMKNNAELLRARDAMDVETKFGYDLANGGAVAKTA